MNTARFRFYAELNDFIRQDLRSRAFSHTFEPGQSVKHLFESLGVPHPEVDLILVNGESVDFGYLVKDGDYVSVYPVFESIDISTVVCVRPRPLRKPQFILDGHLGRLAAYLRMMGFDTLYQNDYTDEVLAKLSSSEKRILLTRDRGLLKRSMVTHGYCLRSSDPQRQLVEVVRRFDLLECIIPFRRCTRCNALLQMVEKKEIEDRLLPGTRRNFDNFFLCPFCDQIYWKGSHIERMERLIQRVAAELGEPYES